MAQVIWTNRAMADVESIVAHVSETRPIAAHRLGQRLFAIGASLAGHPNRGRMSTQGRREIVAAHPYVLRYRIVGDVVVIGSVRHGARNPA